MTIVVSDTALFDLADWTSEPIRKVFAGKDCVMAITDDGRVLQKVSDPSIAARTAYWTRIQEIAISKQIAGVAIGLVSDGTCMISKRPVRNMGWNLERINNAVKSWKNIKQVAASDAFFALDTAGCVHYVALNPYGENAYAAVNGWRNIVRLVPGSQDSIFGIVSDGRVVVAGPNCTNGPHGNLNDKLDAMNDVVDLYPTGSECESVVFLHSDGRLSYIGNHNGPADSSLRFKSLDGFFWYFVVGLTTDNRLIYIMNDKDCIEPGTPVFRKQMMDSFAVDGDGTVFGIPQPVRLETQIMASTINEEPDNGPDRRPCR